MTKKNDIELASNRRGLATDDERLREAQRRRFEEQAQRTLLDGLPRNTFRAYSHDFKVFREWCERQEPPITPIPATEDALLGFLTDLDQKGPNGRYPCRASTIERRLAGIVWAHALANISSPVTPRVSKVLHSIKVRRSKEGERGPQMAAPLGLADLRKISKSLAGKTSPLTIRNRAMVFTGWVCAMRRSEIADLLRDDIGKLDEDGFMLTIRKGKTDQLGVGRQLPVTAEDDTDLCPVVAMRAWLEIRGSAPGPLFWRSGWSRHGEGRQLSDKQVSRIILKLVKDAGVEPESRDMEFSGHSLRAGFITEAIRAGQHDRQVMDRSGHKTHEVFLRYVRFAQGVEKNVATGFSKWGK